MSDVVIRPGTENDWDLVVEGMIEGSLMTEIPERRATVSRDTLREQARRNIEEFHTKAKKPETTFIAEVDGVRAGFIWVSTEISLGNGEFFGWVLDIYVLEEYRRMGIGAILLEKAEEWTKQKKACSLWLNAGANNEAALALYKSLGYSIETVHMSKRF